MHVTIISGTTRVVTHGPHPMADVVCHPTSRLSVLIGALIPGEAQQWWTDGHNTFLVHGVRITVLALIPRTRLAGTHLPEGA